MDGSRTIALSKHGLLQLNRQQYLHCGAKEPRARLGRPLPHFTRANTTQASLRCPRPMSTIINPHHTRRLAVTPGDQHPM
jgi:hypothetical protein